VEVNRLARFHGLLGPLDRRRQTREVDLAGLDRMLDADYPDDGRLFIEGHVSHLLRVGWAIVLRCRPAILRRRLARRGYGVAKVRENSLAEALDAITAESVARLGKGRIFEMDTTRRKAPAVAREIVRLARGGFRPAPKYRPGRVDWSADILRNAGYYSRF
jgi:adenylate kinase